jgi:hypothetical protein
MAARLIAIAMLVFLAERSATTHARALSSATASHVVDPQGSPSSDCRPADPCSTIARAAQVAQAGDVVVIKPGTYAGDVLVQGSGTASRPIIFTAEAPGTVVVVGHIRPATWAGETQTPSGTHPYVTWRGLVVRNAGDGSGSTANCDVGAFGARLSLGWRLEDMLFEQGQSGAWIGGNDVVIERSTFQDLARYALAGAANRAVIRNNVIRRINTAGTMDPACGAVTKFVFSDGYLVEGNQSYDNVGPGLWFDWDNKNYVIRHNTLRNNRGRTAAWQGAGLWLEGNPASNGQVYGNTFADNTGAGLGILETVGVAVYQNTFVGNRQGVELRNIPRGAERVLRNIAVHDNTFNSWTAVAVTTSVGTWTGWSASAYNVQFDRNTYSPPPGTPIFSWLGVVCTTLTCAQTTLGFELNGSLSGP